MANQKDAKERLPKDGLTAWCSGSSINESSEQERKGWEDSLGMWLCTVCLTHAECRCLWRLLQLGNDHQRHSMVKQTCLTTCASISHVWEGMTRKKCENLWTAKKRCKCSHSMNGLVYPNNMSLLSLHPKQSQMTMLRTKSGISGSQQWQTTFESPKRRRRWKGISLNEKSGKQASPHHNQQMIWWKWSIKKPPPFSFCIEKTNHQHGQTWEKRTVSDGCKTNVAAKTKRTSAHGCNDSLHHTTTIESSGNDLVADAPCLPT